MTGCESCEKNLQAELEDVDEEELSKEAKAVMQGEKDAPFAYGPLSSWDGPYCEFCHGVGHILAFMVVPIGLYGGYRFDLPIYYTIAFTLTSYIPLAVTVAYLGRFPILGAMFGPMLERTLAANFNIYVTKKAEREFGVGGYEYPVDTIPNEMQNKDGAEIHVVAHEHAKENCLEIGAPGAIFAAVVENGQITDTHNFHPNMNFNRYRRVHDHVGLNSNTVCDGKEAIAHAEFKEIIRTQGEEGLA